VQADKELRLTAGQRAYGMTVPDLMKKRKHGSHPLEYR
jgi:hypothetical protein